MGGAHWIGAPGVLWIDVPDSELDRYATVVKLEFGKPVELHTGEGGAAESN